METDDKKTLEAFSKFIVDRGMAVPSILFLESVKYLSFFGSQSMLFLGPIITAFINEKKYYKLADLIEDKQNIEFVITEIERLSLKKTSNKSI